MSEVLAVWVFDREQQQSQAAPTAAPARTRRRDLEVVVLSREDDNALQVEVLTGRLSDVCALFWIDGLGWFEVAKVRKLQPLPNQREDRVQLRLTSWPRTRE